MGQKTSKCHYFDCKKEVNAKHIYCDNHECVYKKCKGMIFGNKYCCEHMWKEYKI